MTKAIIRAAASGTFPPGDTRGHRLGFGAMQITGMGVWSPPADRREAIGVLPHEIKLDIDLIGMANSFGPPVGAEPLGEAHYPCPAGRMSGIAPSADRSPSRSRRRHLPPGRRRPLFGGIRAPGRDPLALFTLR